MGLELGPTVGSEGGRAGKGDWIHTTDHPKSQVTGLGLYSAGKRKPYNVSERRGECYLDEALKAVIQLPTRHHV